MKVRIIQTIYGRFATLTFRPLDVSPPVVDVSPPGWFATRTICPQDVSPLDDSPPRRFATWTFRPYVMDDSPPNSSTQLQSLFLWVRHTCTQVSQSINNDLGLHYQRQKYASYSSTTSPLTTTTLPPPT